MQNLPISETDFEVAEGQRQQPKHPWKRWDIKFFQRGIWLKAADDCKTLEEYVEKLFFKRNAKLINRIDYLWGQRKSLGMMGRENEKNLSMKVAQQIQKVLSIVKKDKLLLTIENWESNMGLEGGRVPQEEEQFLMGFKNSFAFGLKDLRILKGQQVQIDLVDDTSIFCKTYKCNETKKELIKAQTKNVFNAHLVESLYEEYASTIVMLNKKDLFGNWIEKRMYGD